MHFVHFIVSKAMTKQDRITAFFEAGSERDCPAQHSKPYLCQWMTLVWFSWQDISVGLSITRPVWRFTVYFMQIRFLQDLPVLVYDN